MAFFFFFLKNSLRFFLKLLSRDHLRDFFVNLQAELLHNMEDNIFVVAGDNFYVGIRVNKLLYDLFCVFPELIFKAECSNQAKA